MITNISLSYKAYFLILLPMDEHKHQFIYEGTGERVDAYLVRAHGYTRNFFHRLIARGDILVNGKVLVKKSLMLKP